MELIAYPYLYYPALVYGFFVSISLRKYWHRLSNGALIIVYLPIIVVYIIGMARSRGKDLNAYKNIFNGISESVYDPGYIAFNNFLNWLGLPFQFLTILFGIISIIAISKLAKSYSINFFPLFLIYLAHLFITTDFSQMRVGVAGSLAIIGFISTSRLRLLIYILSLSFHFSALSFILVSEYLKFLIKLRSIYLKSSGILLLIFIFILMGKNLYLFSFVDERINIYLMNKKYGSEVTDYYQPVFHFLTLIPFIFFGKYIKTDEKLYVLVLLQIMGIVSFYSFSNNAIFAFRLSNLITHLYPVFILYLFVLMAGQINYIKRRAYLFFTILIFILLLILGVRPGSYITLQSIYI